MNQNPHIPSITDPSKRTVHVIRCDWDRISERFKKFEEYKTINDYDEDPTEYDNWFFNEIKNLGYDSKLHLVDCTNYKDIITREIGPSDKDDIVLNLCDGNDIDYPGAAVSAFLEEEGYLYNGTNSQAAKIGCDKNLMKIAFQEAKVPTSPWIYIPEWKDTIEQEIKEKDLKYPLLVKTSNLFSSVGLSSQSVVHNFEEMKKHVQKVLPEYGSIVLEEFLIGREFTCFVFEDENGEIVACPPLEKAFLVENPLDRWQSFDMKWKHFATLMKKEFITNAELAEKVKDLSVRAYKSVRLNGFARMDLRMKDETEEIFLLETNDNCELGAGSSAEMVLNEIGRTCADLFSIYIKTAKRVTTPKSRI